MKEQVHFYLGEETHIVIEDYSKLTDSVFFDQYRTALAIIDRELLPLKKKVLDVSFEATAERSSFIPDNISNNIIGFMGGRGSGKTSCMASLTKMLQGGNAQKDNPYHNIGNTSFAALDIINPSFFDEKANILEIVIGKLFKEFKDSLENRNNSISVEKRTALFSEFQNVHTSLLNIDREKDLISDDDVESLKNLSSAVDLQWQLQSLVYTYLRYVGKDVLLVLIDDMDLHTSRGYVMLEKIRKYLILNNVIILVSMKLDQMESIVQLELSKEYDPLIQNQLSNRESIVDQSSQYLGKLIPQSHRIVMPLAEEMMDAQLKLYQEDSNGLINYQGKRWSEIENMDYLKGTVKYVVTKMIFAKTRYLFYHRQGYISPIVPRSLRDLRHLIKMLYDMPEYEKGGKTEYNKEQFKQYFYTVWAENNLDKTGVKLFNTLLAVDDVSIFNKTVVSFLQEYFRDIIPEEEINLQTDQALKIFELQQIFHDQNVAYNISIADVLSVVSFLKKRITYFYDIRLLFAIETLYSIKLYEYYDLRTEPRYKVVGNMDKLDYSIRIKNPLDAKSNYTKLVGGAFINTRFHRLMTPEKLAKDKKMRKQDDIRRSIIRVKLDLLLREYFSVNEEEREHRNWSKQIAFEELQCIELFALLISRKKFNTKDGSIFDSTYRKNQEIVYFDTAISNKRQSLTGVQIRPYHPNQTLYMDVASILFNITDIQSAYDKIDYRLYPLVNHNPNSLLNTIRKRMADKDGFVGIDGHNLSEENEMGLYHLENYEGEYVRLKDDRYYEVNKIDNRVLSWVSLRNCEIIEDLTNYMVNSANSETTKISQVLNTLCQYEIKTYDKFENGSEREAYTIKFDYLSDCKNTVDKFDGWVNRFRIDVQRDVQQNKDTQALMEEINVAVQSIVACSKVEKGSYITQESLKHAILDSDVPLLDNLTINREELWRLIDQERRSRSRFSQSSLEEYLKNLIPKYIKSDTED